MRCWSAVEGLFSVRALGTLMQNVTLYLSAIFKHMGPDPWPICLNIAERFYGEQHGWAKYNTSVLESHFNKIKFEENFTLLGISHASWANPGISPKKIRNPKRFTPPSAVFSAPSGLAGPSGRPE